MSEGYQSKKISLFSVAEKRKENFTMPRRRERQSPDPEDRGNQRGRGRQVHNTEMERQIRDL